MKKKNKGKKDDIKIIGIILVAFILVALNVYMYINNMTVNSSYDKLKEKKNDLIVYTRYTQTYKEISSIVPYINIKSEIIGNINEDIRLFANENLANKDNVITYEYGINGDILSVVIQVLNYDEVLPKTLFKTYNINLKEKVVLTNNDLLNLYGIDQSFVNSKIEEKFKFFFADERKQGIFDEECDYTCFLFMRKVNNYLDNVYYYVDDGKLYAYKEFSIYSIYDDEKYYKQEDHKILIVG